MDLERFIARITVEIDGYSREEAIDLYNASIQYYGVIEDTEVAEEIIDEIIDNEVIRLMAADDTEKLDIQLGENIKSESIMSYLLEMVKKSRWLSKFNELQEFLNNNNLLINDLLFKVTENKKTGGFIIENISDLKLPTSEYLNDKLYYLYEYGGLVPADTDALQEYKEIMYNQARLRSWDLYERVLTLEDLKRVCYEGSEKGWKLDGRPLTTYKTEFGEMRGLYGGSWEFIDENQRVKETLDAFLERHGIEYRSQEVLDFLAECERIPEIEISQEARDLIRKYNIKPSKVKEDRFYKWRFSDKDVYKGYEEYYGININNQGSKKENSIDIAQGKYLQGVDGIINVKIENKSLHEYFSGIEGFKDLIVQRYPHEGCPIFKTKAGAERAIEILGQFLMQKIYHRMELQTKFHSRPLLPIEKYIEELDKEISHKFFYDDGAEEDIIPEGHFRCWECGTVQPIGKRHRDGTCGC